MRVRFNTLYLAEGKAVCRALPRTRVCASRRTSVTLADVTAISYPRDSCDDYVRIPTVTSDGKVSP